MFLLAGTLSAETSGVGLVRHAPAINAGLVDGSLHQMLPESITLNGGANVTGDLLVPGTPTVRLNGKPNYSGTTDGEGAVTPTNFQVTLNGNTKLRHVVRRTDALPLPLVSAPPSPAGTRVVTINSAGQSPGSFATLRHLTLNGGVGQFVIPPGTYGDFTANGGSGFTLGIAGATQPAIYNFQHLTLNGQTQLQVLGPVIITVANGFTGNGGMGSSAHATWLKLNIYSGGFTLNGACNFYGYVNAPNGTVVVNGSSQLIGGLACDRLTLNGGGLLRLTGISGNAAPVAGEQTIALSEDASAALTLTAIDADGDALVYTVLTFPAHGTLTGVAPHLTYTPAADYNGGDSFTFRANDSQADSNTATITLAVVPVDDRPLADAKSITLGEDAPANVILSGSDVDGNALTFSVVSLPAHGALSGTVPNLIFTPAVNFNGSDSFTYVANDGSLNSLPATVSLVVTAVNDAPTANSVTYAINEGVTLAITLTGSDVDGDALTFAVLTQPTRGVLTGTPPNLSFLPAANFNGLDSFTFRASDSSLNSPSATITIQVSNLNDAPVANNQSVTTAEDNAMAVTLTGVDPDNDAITYMIVTPPAHGTLGGSAPNLTYTPAPDYNGPDGFTFKVRDTSSVDSNTAIVSLSITPVNDAPIADSQAVAVDEDTAVTVHLTGSDVEESSLTYTVVAPPQRGTLSGTAPVLTYLPAPDYNGPDSFTFKVNDGQLDSAVATVSLAVRPVNDAPVGAPQTLATVEDVSLALTLTATDVDSSEFTFAVATPPTHGTLTGTAPNLTYVPDADYNGPDGFTFSASDGTMDSVPATISLSVTPLNDPPMATDQTFSQAQDTTVIFTLSATDVDGDTLTYTIVTPPAHGALSGTAPNLTYTPAFNYRGADALVFSASDGQIASNQATISFDMIAVSHPPVANDQAVALAEDSAANIMLVASDLDGDVLSYAIVTPPAHGSLAGIAPNLTYTPGPDYHGPDSFAFKTNDGSADSNTAIVSLTIAPINDAPAASAQSLTLAEDSSVAVLLSASDVEGDALTYSIQAPPAHGILTGTAPNLTYSPAANYNGPDSFTFNVRDADLESGIATVSFTITPVNDAPSATSQTLTTAEDTPVAITLAGADTDSPLLTFAILTPPTHGTLSGTSPISPTSRPSTITARIPLRSRPATVRSTLRPPPSRSRSSR
jgi:hypothetical protein